MIDDLSKRDYLNQLMKLYEQQLIHLRHHEVMRSQATNYVMAISVALLSLLATHNVFGYQFERDGKLVICVLIVVLNGYGALLSLKHSERSRLHAETADRYRKHASAQFITPDLTPPEFIRKAAHDDHRAEVSLTSCISLHSLWLALHLVVACLAVVLFLLQTTPK